MTGEVLATSPLLYALIAIGLAAIVAFAFVCFKKAKKRCIELGISNEEVNNVVKATITSSLVPSIAILLGFLILASSMGSAWPWWRLSVIGSLSYETMAAQYTVDGMGIGLDALLSSPAATFAGVMIVMTIGVCTGPIIIGFVAEKYSNGIMKAKSNVNGFGSIVAGIFQLALFAVYIPIMLFTNIPYCIAMASSLVCAILLGMLSKKIPALGNFIMAICMIVGMACGTIAGNLLA